MPRVTSRTQPRVRRQALRAPQQTGINPGAFGNNGTSIKAGQQIGQDLKQLSAVMRQADIRRQERDDSSAVYQAETGLRAKYLEHMREQREQRQGTKAKGVTGEFNEWLAKQGGDYASNLGNDRQKELFGKVMDRLHESGNQNLSRFETRQLERAHDEAWSASKIGAARMAITDPSPGNVATVITEIREKNAEQAALRGHPIEWLEAQNTQDLTSMHGQVITAMADQSPKSAKAYYDQHVDQIAPENRARIEKGLSQANDLVQTQERADSIMQMNLSRADAMAYIEKNFEGDDEKQLKGEVNARQNIAEADRTEKQNELYDSAVLSATKGQRIAPSVMSQMSGKQQAAIIKTQREMAAARRKAAQGKKVETNWKVYAKIRSMPDSELVNYNVQQHVNELAGAQLEQLLDRKDTLRKDAKSGTKSTKTKEVATWNRQVSQHSAMLELKGESKAKFEMAADSALRAANELKGSPLTEQERVQALDKLVAPGEVDGWLWDSDKRFFEVQGTSEEKDFTFDVPDADRDEIAKVLRARGKEVTDAEIQRIYRGANGL